MIKKIYKLSLVAFLGFGSFAFAQQVEGKVGINTPNNEDPKATLDIVAKTDTGNAAEGILIPRVSSDKAKAMTGVKESTLVYIKDGKKGAENETTSLVNGKGFYYFDEAKQKWIKVGGGTASTNLNGITGKAQILPSPVIAKQIDNDTFAVIVTGTVGANIALPNPADFEGRVIAVNNQSGSILSFTGDYTPANTNSIESGGGFLLIAHDGKWYLMGGLGA